MLSENAFNSAKTAFIEIVFESVKNVMCNGGNASYLIFLSIQQCFLKPYSLWSFALYQTTKILTLYFIDTHFNASRTDSFWKHCGKNQTISSFPTMISTQSGTCICICLHDIISLYAAELEEPKISMWGKGLNWSKLKAFADNKINVRLLKFLNK